jgi:putative hydrolase of the HAD superfamily
MAAVTTARRVVSPGAQRDTIGWAQSPRRNRRAVLFDFGDTLVQFGNVNKRALFHQACWQTYQMWTKRQKRMPDWRRYYAHQWFAIRWAFLKTTLMRRELDAIRYIRRACRKLWLDAPPLFFDELAWAWYRPLAEVSRIDPAAIRVIQTLMHHGYELALVSNTFVPGFVMDRHLEQLGLLRYFPTRVYSCDVGYRKPHRRIFEIALEQLALEPQQAVFVGDTLDCDVHGATRAGLRAFWLNHADTTTEALPANAMRIRQLAELPVALELNRARS